MLAYEKVMQEGSFGVPYLGSLNFRTQPDPIKTTGSGCGANIVGQMLKQGPLLNKQPLAPPNFQSRTHFVCIGLFCCATIQSGRYKQTSSAALNARQSPVLHLGTAPTEVGTMALSPEDDNNVVSVFAQAARINSEAG